MLLLGTRLTGFAGDHDGGQKGIRALQDSNQAVRFHASSPNSCGETPNSNLHYGARYFEWQSAGGQSLADLERWKFAEFVRASDVVLDFGCGDGRIISGIPCKDRYGVEINPFARVAAARRVKIYSDIGEIPSDVVFDVIVSHHALEHMDDPLQLVQRLKFRLKPGGKAILVVPSETWFNQRMYRADDINKHLYTWTPLSFGNLLSRAGFSVERVELLQHRFVPKSLLISQMMPERLFRVCCRTWGIVTRSRQIRAVAARAE